MRNKIMIGFVVVACLSGLGVVGKMDYQEAVINDSYSCEMINKGLWGAGEERRKECKFNYGEIKNGQQYKKG